MRLTRRGLLRAGGAGAAGFAVGGGLSSPGARAEAPKIADDDQRPNALLIMSSSTRFDFVGAFDDSDEMADTPNLDALAKESLRFQHAVAESMPTVPARRALLTGCRSFPFRDWTHTSQMPDEPGWNPIRDRYQPIVTKVMKDHGVTTAYATDNPFIVGPHFANFRETVDDFQGQLSQPTWRAYNEPYEREAPSSAVSEYLLPALEGTDEETRLRRYLDWNSRNRRTEDDYSTARVGRDAIDSLGTLKDRQPFFLGVDFFDPTEPFDPPAKYLQRFGGGGDKRLIQPFEFPYGRTSDLDLDDAAIERIRQLYAAELNFVDAWIGRVLNELDALGLAGNTMVYYLSDHGISLGERGIVGRFSERAYEEVYRIPYMIRHPSGRMAGEERRFFASTHDVAPTLLSFMGITRPGRMQGEDLTCYFEEEEEEHPPPRKYFTTGFAESIYIGNEDWMLATDGRGSNKRLYEKDEDEGQEENVLNEHPFIETRLAEAIVVACGGTIPVFDDQSAVRPGPEGGEPFVDRDGDGEPDTDEDEDLQDQRDAQERGTTAGQGQGMTGSPGDPRFLFACACGAVLAFKVRRHALAEAERHFAEVHPELIDEVDREELVRECTPEEAEAAVAGPGPEALEPA